VVPIAVIGSERARRGWRVRPVKVRLRIGRPLTFPIVEQPSPHLAAEVTARIWPSVELMWEWLGGLPTLRKAAVIGNGEGAAWLTRLLTGAGLDTSTSGDGDGLELAGLDLVCFAGAPLRPVAERSAVLILSEQLVGPLGVPSSHHVGERVRARAIATVSGPTDSPLIECADADLRAQLERILATAKRPSSGRFRERATAGSQG